MIGEFASGAWPVKHSFDPQWTDRDKLPVIKHLQILRIQPGRIPVP